MRRIIVPGVPYHIFNRGNHKSDVFFLDSDKLLFLKLLDECGERFGVAYLAFCLMNNHMHLNAIPETETSFAKCFAEVKRKYTLIINARESWTGNMWDGRYHSFPMDDVYLFNCVRYSEKNPVKAGIVNKAEDYPWSSAAEHMSGKRRSILRLADIRKHLDIPDWSRYLKEEDDPGLETEIELHARSGRPMGSKEFVERLEKLAGRSLTPKRGGRKRRMELLSTPILGGLDPVE
jgi:putative transposase